MKKAVLLHVIALSVTACWARMSIAQESGKAGERNNSGLGLVDGCRQAIEIPDVKRPNGDAFLRPAKVGCGSNKDGFVCGGLAQMGQPHGKSWWHSRWVTLRRRLRLTKVVD